MRLKYYKILIIGVISFFLLGIIHHLGFFSQYNYFSAQRDVKKGAFALVHIDIPYYYINELNLISSKYGFKHIDIDNQFFIGKKGVSIYNDIMENAIRKKIRDNDYHKYLTELDSLHKDLIKNPLRLYRKQ